MAKVDGKFNIEINRGSMLSLNIKTTNLTDGTPYIFQKDDVVRFKIMEKNKCENVILQKDVIVGETSENVPLTVPSEEMRIGDIISKPVEYWYEVELNPDKPSAVTILGYTKAGGPKILTLTPEGGDKK